MPEARPGFSRPYFVLGFLRPLQTAPAPPSGPQRIIITFYRNGIFTINNGPPRRIDDQANFAFISSISKVRADIGKGIVIVATEFVVKCKRETLRLAHQADLAYCIKSFTSCLSGQSTFQSDTAINNASCQDLHKSRFISTGF